MDLFNYLLSILISLYRAQVSRGTNLSTLNSYWRSRVYGFRVVPLPAAD